MKYSIKVNEVKNGSENVRGIASVTLGDSFKLGNITIVNDPREQGKVFVSMPSYKDGQGEFKDICHPTTKEFHDELYGNILSAFHELNENVAKNSYTVEYNKNDKKMPDFNVRVTPYEREGSSIRGMASINFSGMAVNNVTIHENKDGQMFVSMPSYKTNQVNEQGKPVYKDVCHPVTAKFRDKLYGAILQEYENVMLKKVVDRVGDELKLSESEKDSVLGKLDKNKEAVEQKEKEAGAKEQSKGKVHEQHSREDAR